MFQNISRACASLGTFALQRSPNHSMSLGGELLWYWLVMAPLSLAGSRAAGAFKVLGDPVFDSPLCNLLMAERAYVECMFEDSLPKEFNTNTSKPFWGITLPSENSSAEVLTFVSTIVDCLDGAVPGLVRNLTQPHCRPHILRNITTFNEELKEIRWLYGEHHGPAAPAQCPKQVTACSGFCLKRNGLRILHYARRWVEMFASCGELS